MLENAADTLDFDFNALPQIGNGWLDRLSAIREADPVFWSEHQRGWLVTRHADVLEGFSGRLPLSTARLVETVVQGFPERAAKMPTLMKSLPDWIINSDPPAHTRMRSLMGKAFGHKVVQSVRTFAQGNIETLLDEMEALGTAECNEDLARKITGKTILHLLGVPQEYLPKLKQWSADMVGALAVVNATDEQLAAGERSVIEIFELFEQEIEKRRANPRDDVFTGLVQATDGGDRLTMAEMVGSSVVLLLAGHDTTLNSMVLGVEALSRHPQHRAWIAAHPEGVEKAVIELMRYFAMTGGQTRLVAEDFEWHGKKLKKGDAVYLMIAGANRDPRVFENPETLDFSRDTFQSMTFAPGIHHCIGHVLARMQLTEFFARSYKRFEQIEVLEPELVFSPVWVFRSIPKMDVRFHRRA
jgi:pimeloyl-[acyl-carrier protein] synthase